MPLPPRQQPVVYLAVAGIEATDFFLHFQQGCFPFSLLLVLGFAETDCTTEESHTNAEKLVEIIGVDTQEKLYYYLCKQIYHTRL